MATTKKTPKSAPKKHVNKKTIHPLIAELDSLCGKDLGFKKIAALLKEHYLDVSEYSDNVWYQRLYKFSTGEHQKLKPEEELAIKAFMDTQANPHKLGGAVYKLGDVERKVHYLVKNIQNPYGNKKESARVAKAFLNLS